MILKKSFLALALLAAVGLAQAATSSKVFTFANSGNGPMTLSNKRITGTNAANYSISGDGCTSAVAAGSSCSMTVSFTPTAGVGYSAALQYDSTATNGSGSISLSGTGQASALPAEVKTVAIWLPPGQLCPGEFFGYQLMVRSVGASFTINKIVVNTPGWALMAGSGTLTGGTTIAATLPASVSTSGYAWGGLAASTTQYLDLRGHLCNGPRSPLPGTIQFTTSTGVTETWSGAWGSNVGPPGATVYWTKQ